MRMVYLFFAKRDTTSTAGKYSKFGGSGKKSSGGRTGKHGDQEAYPLEDRVLKTTEIRVDYEDVDNRDLQSVRSQREIV